MTALGRGPAAGACRSSWIRPGRYARGLALAGFAAGRIIGMAVEGAGPDA